MADLLRRLFRRLRPVHARRLYDLDHAHSAGGRRRALDSGPHDIEAYRAGWFR